MRPLNQDLSVKSIHDVKETCFGFFHTEVMVTVGTEEVAADDRVMV